MGLPIGCAASGNTRTLPASVIAVPTGTLAVSERAQVAPVPSGGDQPREQLDCLCRPPRVERLEPRAAEDERGPVAKIALNMVLVVD